MVKVVLDTASGNYKLRIPRNNLLIYHPLPEITPIPTEDVETIIRRGMADPLGAVPLPKLVQGAKTAAVIVDDWARPVVTRHTVAPIVLNLLNELGLSDEDTTLVMARGVGLSPSVETLDAAFGPALLERPVRREINSYHPSCLDFLGYSSRGSPIWIDAVVARADLVIGIGVTFPSPWGGWSGGAKIVVPGVAGAETIRQNHSLMMMGEMGSTDSEGLLDREEMAHTAGLDLLINLVVNLDGQPVELAIGEVARTHRHITQAYQQHYAVELAHKPDIVLTTLDRFKGYPMINLYPFVDGCLPAVELVADPGATVIVAGHCPQGVGPGMGEYMQMTYTAEDLAYLIPQAGTLAFAAVMLGARFARYRGKYSLVAVVDELSEAECQRIGMKKASTLRSALDEALEVHGPQARVAVLPGLGNIILPKLAPPAGHTSDTHNGARRGGDKNPCWA
jgi:nickel-dependent lactate racemase